MFILSALKNPVLVEAKILLKPLNVSVSNAVLAYAKLTKDLEAHGVSLTQAIEEYKSLVKLKERSCKARLCGGQVLLFPAEKRPV